MTRLTIYRDGTLVVPTEPKWWRDTNEGAQFPRKVVGQTHHKRRDGKKAKHVDRGSVSRTVGTGSRSRPLQSPAHEPKRPYPPNRK